jgi:perosamine synthetase
LVGESRQLPATHDKALPFARPDIDEADIAAVVDVMRSGWITTGPKVKEFETAFAHQIGVKHAVALNSGTAALHLALDAIGLEPGDEVIVPTLTFTATAEVVRYFGAKPVMVDIEADTLCLDPAAVLAAVTDRTRAIIPVHIGGHPADMDSIMAIADRHGLPVIEDAAHTFPAFDRGRHVGTMGHLTAFSFYATKTITTGEGGMLVTNDDAYADRARSMSLHGMSRDAWKRYTAAGSWRYDVIAPGFKYNMTDMAAALGLSQLR